MSKYTCTGHRSQGRHPAPHLTLFLPDDDVSSVSAHQCWPSQFLQTHCLHVEELGFGSLSFMRNGKQWCLTLQRSLLSSFPLPDEDFLDLDLSDEDFLVVPRLYTLALFGLGHFINNIKQKTKTNKVKSQNVGPIPVDARFLATTICGSRSLPNSCPHLTLPPHRRTGLSYVSAGRCQRQSPPGKKTA